MKTVTTMPASDDEITADDLPEGWALARLSDVANMRLGKMLDYAKNVGSPTAYLRNVNVRWFSFDLTDLLEMRATAGDRDEFSIEDGDLLVCEGGEPGRCAVWNVGATDLIFQKAIHRIRLSCGVSPTWLALSMKNEAESGRLEEYFTGSGIKHLTGRSLATLQFPLPPIGEQARIVTKIDELVKHVNASRDRLAKVPKILKAFRQSVLAAACSGRLTEDWREKHPRVEPTEAAFVRIFAGRKTERERRNPGNGALAQAIFPATFRVVDSVDLPDIPDSWMYVYLPATGYMNRGTSRHRPRNAPHLFGGPYPFIQTGEVARSGGRIVNHEQTYSKAGLAQSRLWPADTICITIAANIADSAILTYPACFPDSVVGVIADPELSIAEYLEYFIRTARANLAQYAPATAQANINIAILNELAVPLPPLEEQRQIVRRVGILFKLADKIERRVEAATKRADKLTPAILAKAFRGELVSTEAELARQESRRYEPASVLLERIKAEREKSAASLSSDRRKRRRAKSGKD